MAILEERVEQAIKTAILEQDSSLNIRAFWLDDELDEDIEQAITPVIQIVAQPAVVVTHRTGPHRNIEVIINIRTHSARNKDAKRENLKEIYALVVDVLNTTDFNDYVPNSMGMDIVINDGSSAGLDGIYNLVEIPITAKVCGDPNEESSSSS
jgi:hypothetical protein